MTLDVITDASAGTVLIAAGPGERGRILRIDRRLAGLLGGTPEALHGTAFCERIHLEDRQSALEALARLRSATASSYRADGRLVAPDGSVHRVHVYASLVDTSGGPAVVMRVALLAR